MPHIQHRLLSFFWKKALGPGSTLTPFPMSLERQPRILMAADGSSEPALNPNQLGRTPETRPGSHGWTRVPTVLGHLTLISWAPQSERPASSHDERALEQVSLGEMLGFSLQHFWRPSTGRGTPWPSERGQGAEC